MATEIDDLQIVIEASSGDAEKSLNELVATLQELTGSLTKAINKSTQMGGNRGTKGAFDNINKSAKRTAKNTLSLASAIGKFYATYFLAIRGVKKLWQTINSTAGYIESFNYFTVAFGKIASEWDEDWENYGDQNARNYSNAFFKTINDSFKELSGVQYDFETGLLSETGLKNLGYNIQEITQYASQLASVMNAVGQSGETTLATTEAFVKLAGDISSLYNIDYNNAANKIRSVLQGQSRAGYAFGWDTTMANLQALADELDLSKAVSEMSQMEKQQLRILTILKQSRVAWGDQANTIETLSNQIRLLKNNTNEAGLILGQLFTPVLTNLLPIINGTTIALKRLLGDIAGILGVEISAENYGQGYVEIEEDVSDLTGSLEELDEASQKAKSGLRGFDRLNVISTPKSLNELSSTIDLTEEIVKATEEYQKVWDIAYSKMESKAEEFAVNVEKYLEPVKSIFSSIVIGDYITAGEDFSGLLEGITAFVSNAVDNVDWDGIGEKAGQFFGNIDWATILYNTVTAIFSLKSGIFTMFSTAIDQVDWYSLGEEIGDKLEEVNWEQLLSAMGELLLKAIQASVTLWMASFDSAPIETSIVTAIAAMKFSGLTVPFFLSSLTNAITTALADGVKVSFLKIVFGSFGLLSMLGTPAGQFIGEELFTQLESWIKEKFGEEMLNALSTAIASLEGGAIGAMLGGPIGALVGTIVGLIIAAFSHMGNSRDVWDAIMKTVFNFDEAQYWFKKTKETFIKIVQGDLNFFEVGVYMVKGILEGLTAFAKFLLEPFTDLKDWIIDKICGVFGIHSPADETEFIGKNIVLGIAEGFSDGFDALKQKLKELWNSIADWLNDKMTFTIDPVRIAGRTIFAGTTIDLGFIPKFATGGFPENGLFYANNSELVGKFSNGKTAVANNSQITAGIEEASYRGMMRALNQFSSRSRTGTSGSVVVQIDGREVARAVQKEANGYFNSTGNSYFAF